MDWHEFLDTANRLAPGAAEGDWRSAVSRAYYSIFHFFREWLRQRGLDLGAGGQAHANLYHGLNNCGIAALIPVASKVDDLRNSRTEADYDLRSAVDQLAASNAIARAQLVVADFQSVLTSVPPQEVADGAKKYLRSIGRII